MDLDLWSLATAIRNDPASAAVFGEAALPEIARRYRAADLPGVVQIRAVGVPGRYGHRAVAEIDVGMPRWSDDPTHILGVLANYLRMDDPALAPDRQFGKAAREADAQVARLVAAAGQRSRLRGALVRAALRRTRMFAGLRELPKYHLVEALGAVRQQLAAVGAELAAAGAIDAADDIFFVDLTEAHRGLGGAALQGLVHAAPGGVRGRTGPPAHSPRAALGRHRARGRADQRVQAAAGVGAGGR